MILATGSNVFGQWLRSDRILSNLEKVSIVHRTNSIYKAKLIYVSWSYNIYLQQDQFYISGAWLGKDNEFIKVILPAQIKDTPVSNLILIGNDYKLVLIESKTHDFWVLEFSTANNWNWVQKKIHLNVEVSEDQNSTQPEAGSIIVKAVLNGFSVFCLTSNGEVYELPTRTETSHCIGKAIDIDCGNEHAILLTDAGVVYTWGNGRRCQLGHGDISNVEAPTEVQALAGIKIKKIKAGSWHNLALSEFGDLYAWGWNDTGQLGVKKEIDKPVQEDLNSYALPMLVDLFDNDEKVLEVHIRDIACGSRHSAILLLDNTLWTSGVNKYGQLGVQPDKMPFFNYFTNVSKVNKESALMCGPWSTIVVEP